jgi:hypothetical protein
VRIVQHLPLLTTAVAFTAIAVALLCWFYVSKSRTDDKAELAAADAVYEAVVRDMLTPAHGQSNIKQLVFGDTVLTMLTPGADIESCKESVRKRERFEDSRPPFNTLADKIYRTFSHGWDDGSLRTDTIQDFLEKSCTMGPISTTFHTDLPRTFTAAESVHFRGWPIESDESRSFEELFPGAPGIISFSHVGFNSSLHEGIVFTAFVCGDLCGTGWRYILRKNQGRWEVVEKFMVWVS